MNNFKFKLGDNVKDLITGFTGIITGRAEHVTGCNTYGVTSKVDKDNKGGEIGWYDENRIEIIKNKPNIMSKILKNSEKPEQKEKKYGACGNPSKSHGKL
jgi:hypothetical protein